MPFPPRVREKALVASARHCCVCHRYKGVRVEVHHIVPEVNGGANTLDNAITLCFDCHADAGHYSILHPRGTKFSSNELKLARDVWHKTVKKNEITDEPRQQDSLYCRYLICRDFGAIREVVQGNLSKLPVTTPVLANAPTLPFLKEVVQAHKEDYRVARKWGGAFDSNDHYIQSHPDAKKISETEIDGQKFWEFERTPSSEELQQNVLNHDYISRSLFEHGMPTVEVCRLRAVTNYCGNPPLQEEYQLRPLWAVFLAITNSSGNRIRLNTIEGAVNNGAFDTVRTLDSHDTENPISLLCPQAELLPEWTAIIPVATILAPLGVIIEEEGYGTRSEVEPALVQALTHVFMANETTNECYTWGPRFRVSAIRFTQEGAEYVQEMHELDVANVYVIDRHWMMGCCPHVFAVRSTGEVDYLGEIFTLLT